MITWMQKHKKYLVVTVWISTIAFVGANFVSWGAYDFNLDRAGSVAKVGHRKISIQQLQQKYNTIYNYYNTIFAGNFNKEKADEFKIEKLALDAAINESLLLNLADDIGFVVSDDDILKNILSDINFQTNGQFDKKIYYDILNRSGIKSKEYEESLKDNILLQKLENSINLKTTDEDLKIIQSASFMQDKISIKIISVDDKDIQIKDKDLENFWKPRKDNYLTKINYDLSVIQIKPKNNNFKEKDLQEFYKQNIGEYSEKGLNSFEEAKKEVINNYNLELAKKDALNKYIKLKKSEIKTNTKLNISEDDDNLDIQKLENLKSGDIFKPIKYKDGYIIGEIKSINQPAPKSFKDAKDEVIEHYKEEKIKEVLDQKAQDYLKNGKLKDIGFVDKNSKINGLTENESQDFLNSLFNSNNKKSYFVVNKKAIIYEILEQKLLLNNEKFSNVLKENFRALKNSKFKEDLNQELRKRYKIEQYIQR